MNDRPTEILVDTNIWLLIARRRFPLFRELERLALRSPVVLPVAVASELDLLSAQGAEGARLARDIARRSPRAPTRGRGDSAIVRRAIARGGWVVTADRALARELRSRGVTVLMPRGMAGLSAFPPVSAGAAARRLSARGNRYVRPAGRKASGSRRTG
jgi:rRNA-processing protein FCF1